MAGDWEKAVRATGRGSDPQIFIGGGFIPISTGKDGEAPEKSPFRDFRTRLEKELFRHRQIVGCLRVH